MIRVAPRTDLLFFYSPGCVACEEAEPELEQFSSQTPMTILKLRADGPLVPMMYGKRIRATPTYVLRIGDRGYAREGMMTAKEIGEWIKSIAEGGDE